MADAKELALNLLKGVIARMVAFTIDARRMRNEPYPHVLYATWQDVVDRQNEIKQTGVRDPEVDFGLELHLFPRAYDVLIDVTTEQAELQAWFDKLPFVEDFSYWDNTDPPENATSAEWESRCQAWNEVLPYGATMSERCLTFEITPVGPAFVPTVDEIIRHLPDDSRRLSALALHVQMMKALQGADKADANCVVQALLRASKNADDRIQTMDQISKYIRPILADDLRQIEK